MVDKVLATFLVSEFLFVACGAILIGFTVVMQNQDALPPVMASMATSLLIQHCPTTAAIVDAIFIFITFAASIPALIMPTTRGWLKLHGYMVLVCAIFTLVLGLDIWFSTLKTRENLLSIWTGQTSSIQSLLQQEFGCCGYLTSTPPDFVTDTTCTSAVVALQKVSCVGPLSNFANNYLDILFTAAFGIVGVDVAMILATAMLLRDRKEKARYRHIDEKNGIGGFWT